jgi:multidrug efflux pump subunit AcrA (membrane-fusion protein)
MLRRYSWVKALVCLVLLIAGCGRNDAAPATPTTASTLGTTGITYVVQRGEVTRELEFAGRVSPVAEVPLYFRISGYVSRVLVQSGAQVKAGDLLAELEVEDLQNQVALAELDLASAQARLAQAEGDNAYAVAQAEKSLVLAQEQLARTKALGASYNADVAQARLAVEEAQDTVVRADYEYKKALDRVWETQDVWDAYALLLQQAQWDLEAAQAQNDQAIANELAYQRDLRIAQIAVEQAQAELTQLRKGVDPALAIDVRRAQQVLDRLRESSQIVAPVDGSVISLSLYPGRPVEPFRTAVVIADLSAIEVSADLSSDQLEDLTEGQWATVVLTAYPDRSWAGSVRRLPYPYGTGASIENTANVDNSTRISLEGDLGELRVGDLVKVTVVLEERDEVLWVPPDAIRAFQSREFVIVQDAGRQRRVDVELGVVGQDRAEILQGLEEGQVVVAP